MSEGSGVFSPQVRTSPCTIYRVTTISGKSHHTSALHCNLKRSRFSLGVSSKKYQFDDHALDRYMSHFGPLNQQITLANHSIWMIDAPGLVDEDRERAVAHVSFRRWAELRPDRTIGFVDSSARGALSICTPGEIIASPV